MSSVYRSRVLDQTGTVISVLPTWSDGALVRSARPDLTVQDGEWHGEIPGMRAADAPEPTHQSAAALLAELS